MRTEPVSSSRPYTSPLRALQAEQARELVLDAAVDLLAEEGAAALSNRAVARRAGVSPPTVARYFPTPDDLLRGIDERLTHRLGVTRVNLDGDGVLAALRTIYEGMEREERVMRAYLAAPASREHGRRRRRRFIETAFAPRLASLSEKDREAVLATLQLFMSSATWSLFRDVWGIRGADAAHVAHWAMCTLLAAASAHPPSSLPLPSRNPFDPEPPP